LTGQDKSQEAGDESGGTGKKGDVPRQTDETRPDTGDHGEKKPQHVTGNPR
jgi:hypothetical protein